MNPFADRYKKLTDTQLIKIVDAPGDYQPEAIEAASEELAARQLTDEELIAIREENQVVLQKQQLKKEKNKALEDKAKDMVYNITDALNPIQSEKQSTPKAILWISILMILLFLYQLYTQFGLLKYMLTYDSAKWSFYIVFYFLRSLVILPLAAILFALRKKSGWVLLSGFFTYMAFNTITLIYFEFRYPHDEASPLDHLLPSAPANSLIGWVIFVAGLLYFIYKKDVREIYNISMKNILTAVGIGVLLMLSSMVG